MVTDLSKVYILPKMKRIEKDNFQCPCQICAEKYEYEKKVINVISQVQNEIEDILSNSSASRKNLQLDIYPSEEKKDTQSDLDQITDRESEKLIKFSTTLSKFINEFNKKYRHPLVCELETFAVELSDTITNHISSTTEDATNEGRLWRYLSVIHFIQQIQNSLLLIKKEQFINEKTVEKLFKTCTVLRGNSIKFLRSMFIDALNEPTFQPNCIIENFNPLAHASAGY